jgi:hypothetical protein
VRSEFVQFVRSLCTRLRKFVQKFVQQRVLFAGILTRTEFYDRSRFFARPGTPLVRRTAVGQKRYM